MLSWIVLKTFGRWVNTALNANVFFYFSFIHFQRLWITSLRYEALYMGIFYLYILFRKDLKYIFMVAVNAVNILMLCLWSSFSSCLFYLAEYSSIMSVNIHSDWEFTLVLIFSFTVNQLTTNIFTSPVITLAFLLKEKFHYF